MLSSRAVIFTWVRVIAASAATKAGPALVAGLPIAAMLLPAAVVSRTLSAMVAVTACTACTEAGSWFCHDTDRVSSVELVHALFLSALYWLLVGGADSMSLTWSVTILSNFAHALLMQHCLRLLEPRCSSQNGGKLA